MNLQKLEKPLNLGKPIYKVFDAYVAAKWRDINLQSIILVFTGIVYKLKSSSEFYGKIFIFAI